MMPAAEFRFLWWGFRPSNQVTATTDAAVPGVALNVHLVDTPPCQRTLAEIELRYQEHPPGRVFCNHVGGRVVKYAHTIPLWEAPELPTATSTLTSTATPTAYPLLG